MSFLFVGNEEPVIVGGIGNDRNSPLKHIQNIPLFKAQIGDYQFIAKSQHELMPGYLKGLGEYLEYCNKKAKNIYYLELSIHFGFVDETINFNKTLTKEQKEKKRDYLLDYILAFLRGKFTYTPAPACRTIKYEYIENEPLKITYLMMPSDMEGFMKLAFLSIPIYVIVDCGGIRYNYNNKFRSEFNSEDEENYIYMRPPVSEDEKFNLDI